MCFYAALESVWPCWPLLSLVSFTGTQGINFAFLIYLHNQNTFWKANRTNKFCSSYWVFFFFTDFLPCSKPPINTERIFTSITQLFDRQCSLKPSLALQALRRSCERDHNWETKLLVIASSPPERQHVFLPHLAPPGFHSESRDVIDTGRTQRFCRQSSADERELLMHLSSKISN